MKLKIQSINFSAAIQSGKIPDRMRKAYRIHLLVFFLLFVFCSDVFAQLLEADIRVKLDLIYSGQADRIRTELPALLKQYPSDAGIAFIDAILTVDGSRAVKKYQSIIDTYPASDWADDALFRTYQYYYSIGLYSTADKKFEQLKQQYPNSVFIAGMLDDQTVSFEKEIPAPPPAVPLTTAAAPAESVTTSSSKPVQERPEEEGFFSVQTGAFTNRQTALKQTDFLTTLGKRTEIVEKNVTGKTLFIVLVKGFLSEPDARSFITMLKTNHNLTAIIISNPR